MSMTPREVYNLARSTGLAHGAAVTATAVALGESGLNPRAVGDTSLTTSTWGPSIGLWQVRSLVDERGTGRTRDGSRLTDPGFNARAMYEISRGGRDWSPWTVYTTGAYIKHLSTVRAAVGEGAGDGYGGEPAAWRPSPMIPDWINPLDPDNPAPGPDDLAEKGQELRDDVRGLVLSAVVVAGGVLLVLVGAAAASRKVAA